jgi:phosphoglycolate phosphatase-like HAD superfamily hydrolase
MKVLTDKSIFVCDVDDTLVTPVFMASSIGDDDLVIDFYGKIKLEPIYENIEVLKRMKQEGYFVIVWHNGSTEYSKKVVKKLKLDKYVDIVMEKPSCYADDLKPKYILGQKVGE